MLRAIIASDSASSGICLVSMPSAITTMACNTSRLTTKASTPKIPALANSTVTICGVRMVMKRPSVLQKPVPRMRIVVGNNSGTYMPQAIATSTKIAATRRKPVSVTRSDRKAADRSRRR